MATNQKTTDKVLNSFRESWTKDLARPKKPQSGNGGLRSHTSMTAMGSGRPLTNGGKGSMVVPAKRIFSDIFEPNRRNPSVRSTQLSFLSETENTSERNVARKFVVGLDYGTTFTSVSYTTHPIDDEKPTSFPWEVKTISSWPHSGILGSRLQVPSESWYPSNLGLHGGKGSAQSVDALSDDGDQPASDEHSSSEYVPGDPAGKALDEEAPTQYLWGYAVPFEEYSGNTSRSTRGLVKHAKSKLLDTPYTQQDRKVLGPVLDVLIQRKFIRKYGKTNSPSDPRDVQDVLTDFLIKIFAHVKEQLEKLEGFSDMCKVQFVLTVPTIWSPQSSRILQKAMEIAIQITAFAKLSCGSINDLFIISEPEAAATFLIADSKNIRAGETFVILDAGGGTVDAITYTVASEYPLRLEREEVPPGGDNCGASYLNENFKNLLEERLKDETYLYRNGETVESIVHRLIPKFEDQYKRRVDVTEPCGHMIYVSGLRGDIQQNRAQADAKRFESNSLIMNRQDYKTIFLPLLERVVAILAEQLRLAFENGKEIQKVFLVGGFGNAPSLRSHLRNYLAEVSLKLDKEIALITADEQHFVTAVSSGAVLRAHNLENGPDRIVQSSYGFLRMEPYEPNLFPGHKVATPWHDEVDGEDYVQSIVYFVVKGGKAIPQKCVCPPMRAIHTFETTRKRFLCEEVLYVSDTATESHFPRTDSRNKDAVVAGKIHADKTFLRDEGHIKPIVPANGKGQRHYSVEYELVAIIEGRNLRYEARYPPGGKVRKRAQVSIAAAFRPGTG